MKIQMPWKKKKIILERDLQIVEKRLSSTLRSVEPRPEFLRSLRVQVVGKEQKRIFGLSVGKAKERLLVVGGIFSLAIVVFTGIRTILAILSALGLMQLKKRVEETPQEMPFHPVT
jgi:repressor of nif and glnA expression